MQSFTGRILITDNLKLSEITYSVVKALYSQGGGGETGFSACKFTLFYMLYAVAQCHNQLLRMRRSLVYCQKW